MLYGGSVRLTVNTYTQYQYDIYYLDSRRVALTGQSAGWALVNATSRRSLRLLCSEYGKIECKNLYAIWRRNHGERSMYRRDDEKLQPLRAAAICAIEVLAR